MSDSSHQPLNSMTLIEFERYANGIFDQELHKVIETDEGPDQQFVTTLFCRLETTALKNKLEICKRGAYLLAFALYDEYLEANAEALLVPPEYFNGQRPEDEARAYLNERRLGSPAYHVVMDPLVC